MTRQRQILVTVTYNDLGCIIDTKAEPYEEPNLQPTCNNLATDTISRQDAINAILADKITDDALIVMKALGDGRLALTLNDACDRHIRDIEKLPSVESERKKGKWIPQNMNKSNGMTSTAVYYPKCSVCGCDSYYTNFCPNCGTDMRGDD